MSHNPRVHAIKRAQKEKLLLREISLLFLSLIKEHPQLGVLTPTRTELSTDKGTVHVFFYTAEGIEKYEELLELLKLYRPSMRKNLAQKIRGRYVPEIRFHYDDKFTKQERFEQIMEKVKTELDS